MTETHTNAGRIVGYGLHTAGSVQYPQEDIEDLVKRATINFPGPLNLGQTEDLLEYIAREMPGKVYLQEEVHKTFSFEPKVGNLVKDQGTIGISATIINSCNPVSFDSCESVNYDRDSGFISGLRFFMVPGFDIPDYRPERMTLWDKVRDLVEDYFYGPREAKTE